MNYKNFIFKFPDRFLWGAFISSHQVEGNNFNNWTEWEKINAIKLANNAKNYWQKWQQEKFPEMFLVENYISGKASDHYNKFEIDFKLSKKLNHNATRFSIEWSRIEPENGRFNQKEIEYYKNIINLLKELKIEPFITLWHWTISVWLSKICSFENNKIVDYFSRYTEKIVNELGKDVKFWITINEPEIYYSMSYFQGIWPPQKQNIFKYLKVFYNFINVHKKSYQVIKSINSNFQIGIAKNNSYFESYQNKFINNTLKKIAD